MKRISKQTAWTILLVAVSAALIVSPQAHSDGLFLENNKPWIKEMGPTAGSLLINDRPTRYEPLSAVRVKQADEKFKKSLDLAYVEHEIHPIPKLLVNALCNYAAFCYRQADFGESAKLFSRALRIQRETAAGDSAEIADLLSCLALVHRARREYKDAIPCLAECLEIRKRIFGLQSKEVACTYMELAQLAHDEKDDKRASEWENEAKKIAGGEFVSRYTTLPEDRPLVNSSLQTPRDYLPAMLNDAEAVISQIEEWKTQRQQQELAQQEEERRKQKAEADKLAADRANALAALNRSAEDDEYSADAPGFATITGRALYPIGEKSSAHFITKQYSPKLIKTEATGGGSQTARPIPIEVALCKTSLKNSIARRLMAYAEQNDQSLDKFGDEWPSTMKLARPLMNEIGEMVVKHKIPKPNWITESDGTGEYIFRDIPKGNYVVYAQLVYEGECLYWLIPLEVSNKRQITLDILKDNVSHYVWQQMRENHAAQM